MLMEKYLDNRLMVLYQKLTKSDFKGNVENEYIVSLLYALRCIDRCNRNNILIPEKKYVSYAREIIRIYETCEEQGTDRNSIMAWTKSIFSYIATNKADYKMIHKMSTVDLINELSKYMD